MLQAVRALIHDNCCAFFVHCCKERHCKLLDIGLYFKSETRLHQQVIRYDKEVYRCGKIDRTMLFSDGFVFVCLRVKHRNRTLLLMSSVA